MSRSFLGVPLARIFKNPNLTDYFVDVEDVRLDRPCPSIVELYESAKVLCFPKLKLDIDHDFWASVPLDDYPGLKKTKAADDSGRLMRAYMHRVGVPNDMAIRVQQETEKILDQVLPVYAQLFAGYEFTQRKIAWRLNTVMNESLHLDSYGEPNYDHFARLFINLDNQPRIWTTSFTVEELYERFGRRVVRKMGKDASADALQNRMNKVAFGRTADIWWCNQPRHVIYFDPGDVWAVDSRQVSHQIFYGRRAASIDFFVDSRSMQNPRRHYLAIAEDFIERERAPSRRVWWRRLLPLRRYR